MTKNIGQSQSQIQSLNNHSQSQNETNSLAQNMSFDSTQAHATVNQGQNAIVNASTQQSGKPEAKNVQASTQTQTADQNRYSIYNAATQESQPYEQQQNPDTANTAVQVQAVDQSQNQNYTQGRGNAQALDKQHLGNQPAGYQFESEQVQKQNLATYQPPSNITSNPFTQTNAQLNNDNQSQAASVELTNKQEESLKNRESVPVSKCK